MNKLNLTLSGVVFLFRIEESRTQPNLQQVFDVGGVVDIEKRSAQTGATKGIEANKNLQVVFLRKDLL